MRPIHHDHDLGRRSGTVRTRLGIGCLGEPYVIRSGGLNLEHVRALVAAGADVPPILVHHPGMRIIDGAHRVAAARSAGRGDIEVEFFHGSDDEAFRLGVKCNIRHGLPLSLADRRAAALRIMKADPGLSDRAIAHGAGLSAKTVAGLRSPFVGEGPDVPRTGIDGRVRPSSTAAGRIRAGQIIAERPAASLREIAREAGIALGTARDVRLRVFAGQDPVPDRFRRDAFPATVVVPVPGLRQGGAATRSEAVDVTVVFRKLRDDPSLRYSDSGRSFLRWLNQHLLTRDEAAEMLEAVPDHCRTRFAAIAQECGQAWLALSQTARTDTPAE